MTITPATDSPPASSAPGVSPSRRIVAVDALRGFDMLWISGGDAVVRSFRNIHDGAATRVLANQMEHCDWAGFHFYDLIFPLFVFIVGVSIPLSITGMLQRAGLGKTLLRIVLRSVLLFLLGIFYMGGVADGFQNMYFAGVLHRIAVAYFFAALLFCFMRPRSLAGLAVALLVGYWLVMTCIPVPGIGAPDLSVPGKNLAHYLDERFLPGRRFEGTLLSTMAAVANCLLGILAGSWLREEGRSGTAKVKGLALAGLVSLLLGIAWAPVFPVIKLLWTSSYVMISCGLSALLLALFYQVIEVWNYRRWALPFIWLGMNAITIYLVANIVGFHRLALRFVGGDVAVWLGRFSELATSLLALTFALLVVRFLYRRAIFLRL